jgi:tripartite-type tricarboxylate transporter receptor subunit TctC
VVVALYPNLKYDPTKDFEPIGLAAGTPILIVARKDFPAADLKEFVARLKDPAAKVKQAHAGVGSVSFTSCTLLSSQLGVKNIVAAYRGTGPALNDLVGGQVDYMCDQIVNLVEPSAPAPHWSRSIGTVGSRSVGMSSRDRRNAQTGGGQTRGFFSGYLR